MKWKSDYQLLCNTIFDTKVVNLCSSGIKAFLVAFSLVQHNLRCVCQAGDLCAGRLLWETASPIKNKVWVWGYEGGLFFQGCLKKNIIIHFNVFKFCFSALTDLRFSQDGLKTLPTVASNAIIHEKTMYNLLLYVVPTRKARIPFRWM